MSRAGLALLAALWLGCGDNVGTASDAGDPVDARRFADADALACAADAGCPAGPTPVCDLARAACVECTAPADCAMPAALGPRCDARSGTCTCGGDDDCAGRASGPTCHPIVRACTCAIDGDCPGEATCELDPYLGSGVRTCVLPAG